MSDLSFEVLKFKAVAAGAVRFAQEASKFAGLAEGSLAGEFNSGFNKNDAIEKASKFVYGGVQTLSFEHPARGFANKLLEARTPEEARRITDDYLEDFRRKTGIWDPDEKIAMDLARSFVEGAGDLLTRQNSFEPEICRSQYSKAPRVG